MQELLLLLQILVTVLVVLIVLRLNRRSDSNDMLVLEQRFTQRVDTLQQSFESRVASLDERLTRSIEGVHQTVSNSLGSSAETLRQTSERLATIDAAAKRIVEEFGPALTDLQSLMKAPGARGTYGEFLLEQLLGESLPSEHFTTQYTFNDGQRVDAIVRLPDGILPVDSKFPLDGFRRYVSTSSENVSRREWREFLTAVRKHIDNVQKYIRPQEGTLPVALMYIPSEAVYYEIVVRNGGFAGETNSITAYARDRSVFIVSPNTLYSYLQAIAVGLRGLRIGQRAKEVLNHIEGLRREFANVQECLSVLGSHLNKAKNKQEELARLTDRCQDRLSLASSLESSAPRSELNP